MEISKVRPVVAEEEAGGLETTEEEEEEEEARSNAREEPILRHREKLTVSRKLARLERLFRRSEMTSPTRLSIRRRASKSGRSILSI